MSHDIGAEAERLADLMDEFRLSEAKLEGDDWKVAFRRKPKVNVPALAVGPVAEASTTESADEPIVQEQGHEVPKGTPISSPMTGIFYAAPSPSAPPFVKEGETVTAGTVVALIEAMKVFNEIVAPQSGVVSRIVAKTGEVVNPGEPLMYIG